MTEPAKQTPDDVANQIAVGLASMATMMAPVLEAVEGYRVRCEGAGYSSGLAQKMAADYHAAILRMYLK